jgi:HEPN domain-containing protein
MKKSANAVRLLAGAGKDLRALEGMIADRKYFSDEVFGFHAQQAVEKTLKAWIAAIGKEYPFTHDLSQLFGILSNNGIAIDEWLDFLELCSFGVQFRYEDMDIEDEPLDRPALLSKIKLLADRISKEVHGE